MYLKHSSHWPCTRRTLLFDQCDIIFLQVWLCVLAISCEVCKEDRKSELHFFQKPRLIFCSNPQRYLWLEVEGSSSGTERTSPVRKCEGVSVHMHSMSESLTYERGLEFSNPSICVSKVVNSSKVNMVSPNTLFR
ncbi:hypothetical protein TNCV_1196561 [Trichonephila clavipes]|uniref:Uncharacterized protein n=1 Tax=Trichonephila clavipes TaxID=2585209 RepID=A0A8X6S8F3_TRICX|nr:hypothetical protein TNCV_1196561 [Trichonephila clavipes]